MSALLPHPRLFPSGDSAVVVEFAHAIDDIANQRVLALDKAVAAASIEGVLETVPTYRSLLVHYDPERIDFAALGAKLLAMAQAPLPPAGKARRWRVPVAYGGENGIDLEDVAKRLDVTPDEVVARHSGGDYRVAMVSDANAARYVEDHANGLTSTFQSFGDVVTTDEMIDEILKPAATAAVAAGQ